MTDTRGPKTGKVPPHVKQRLDEKQARREQRSARMERLRIPMYVGGALILLLIGFGIGRATEQPFGALAEDVRAELLPLANQADALWRNGLADKPAVIDAVDALNQAGATDDIDAFYDVWLADLDAILVELRTADVGTEAYPIVELLAHSVEMNRHAIVVLGAAAAHEGSARAELLAEVLNVRVQAQRAADAARSALSAWETGRTTVPVGVPEPPPLTRPDADPPVVEPPAGDGEAGDGEAGADETESESE